MKNQTIYQIFSITLLFTALALLPGCNPSDWMKSKPCQSCELPSTGTGVSKVTSATTGAKTDGLVLASIAGEPEISMTDFNEFWDFVEESDPNARAVLQLMPGARLGVFKDMLMQAIVQHDIKHNKRDQDPKYKKKVQMQSMLAARNVAYQDFQERVLEKIDKSDSAVQAFFEKNKTVNPQFQQPPFVKTAGGVKAEGVQFTSEKQAKDFLEKARTGDFATLAKEAKKTVNDFGGPVNAQSRHVDSAVKEKLLELKSVPALELVKSGKNYWVIKALSKEERQYAPFNEVKDYVTQVMLQTQFPEAVAAEIEKLKKQYNVDDSVGTKFFEEEKNKREAELQEQVKAMESQREEAVEPQTPQEKAKPGKSQEMPMAPRAA